MPAQVPTFGIIVAILLAGWMVAVGLDRVVDAIGQSTAQLKR